MSSIRNLRSLRAAAMACASFLGGGFTVVHAQQPLDAVKVGAGQCTIGRLGAPIDPKLIGLPVAAVQLDKVDWYAATERSPAVCVVEGQLLPLDKTPTAFPIRFAVGLPGEWNRRSIHQGGGGINGTVPRFAPPPPRPAAPGAAPAGPPMGAAPPSDIARGFAVYGSDSGHGQDITWSLNDEAIQNFGYAQLKKTHDVAQILIQRLYGSAPRYRYFMGNSQGGREALTSAQRYPADYDGVAANVPVLQLNGLMAAPAEIRRQEMQLARLVPQTKVRAIAAEFMRQCDGLDGLVDGVMNDYMQCRAIFNVRDKKGPGDPWSQKRCPGNVDPDPADKTEKACLTNGQIETLQFVFSPAPYGSKQSNGLTAFGMWPPSTEVATGGMGGGNSLLTDTRYAGQEGAASDARVFSSLGSPGITGFLLRDLSANPLTYGKTPALAKRERQMSEWMDSTNPDLRAFEKRGGKMIVAIGTNDTLASPGAQLDYYAALSRKMGGKLDGFARLYVLPQRGHGLTGSSYTYTGDGKAATAVALPSQFDRLAMLQKWVEQGEAPAKTQLLGGQNGSSGLMCSYPQYPHYDSGDPMAATSWGCRQSKF